jgi:hypothetical protein
LIAGFLTSRIRKLAQSTQAVHGYSAPDPLDEGHVGGVLAIAESGATQTFA